VLDIYRVWQELDYRIDICRVTNGGHIEHLEGRTETCIVSPSVDMLPFGVTVPATVPQRSEFQEGLMNYPVFISLFFDHFYFILSYLTTLTTAQIIQHGKRN
jgi:hypothetical protein